MNNLPALTVAICTHNPRPSVFSRTLDALRSQSLPVDQWDLLIIDNASTANTIREADLSWHPNAQIVLEPELGIAAARHKAVSVFLDSPSSILLFVDDDNLLEPTYLSCGLQLANSDLLLHCWGGQLIADYEVPPPEYILPYTQYLAIFPLEADRVIQKFTGNHDDLPPTAGMFIRRALAERHRNLVTQSPLRLLLGGRGSYRIGGEDTDIALTALESGWRTGRFKSLVLHHVIPRNRLTLEYLESLMQGIRAGTLIVHFLRGSPIPPKPGLISRLRQFWQLYRLPELTRRIYAAELRGEAIARRIVAEHPAK